MGDTGRHPPAGEALKGKVVLYDHPTIQREAPDAYSTADGELSPRLFAAVWNTLI